MDYDVSVIGLGRVGLPLALSFADRGLRVLGIDNDPERTGAVRDGRMPFEETGMQEVLDRVGPLDVSDRAADAARARHIVITLGTPEFVAGYLEKHRGFTIGGDVFVAHAPERIAAGRFREEIGTLPCIVG